MPKLRRTGVQPLGQAGADRLGVPAGLAAWCGRQVEQSVQRASNCQQSECDKASPSEWRHGRDYWRLERDYSQAREATSGGGRQIGRDIHSG